MQVRRSHDANPTSGVPAVDVLTPLPADDAALRGLDQVQLPALPSGGSVLESMTLLQRARVVAVLTGDCDGLSRAQQLAVLNSLLPEHPQ